MTFQGPYTPVTLEFYTSTGLTPRYWRKGDHLQPEAPECTGPAFTHQPSALGDPSEVSLKTLCVANARPQLHKIGKILLGNDHSPLELWKTLPQTERTFPVEKKS